MCDSNLRKTVRYGGRKNPPGEEEIEAIIVGCLMIAVVVRQFGVQ